MPETDGQQLKLAAPLLGCRDGRVAPNVALMQLLCSARDQETAWEAVRHIERTTADHQQLRRLRELSQLWSNFPQAFALLKQISSAASPSETGRNWASAFDKAAAISPEASVALYSMGDPELLSAITSELVACISGLGLLAPNDCVLDLGCGIGRVSAVAAPLVGEIVALDVSAGMTEIAHKQLKDFRNALVVRSDGTYLSGFRDECFELMLAVDSFPYLVESGLAEQHISEAWRVLKPQGHLLIMNYSYRGDLALDQAEVAHFGERYGFIIQRNGTQDLALWDGRTFLLCKPVKENYLGPRVFACTGFCWGWFRARCRQLR